MFSMFLIRYAAYRSVFFGMKLRSGGLNWNKPGER